MTDKDRLNALLRLRLLRSTERELSALIGYNLHGNHFNRMKPFTCAAYYARFAAEVAEATNGSLALGELLEQYEATSRFFMRHVRGTRHERRPQFLPLLLRTLMHPAPEHREQAMACAPCAAYLAKAPAEPLSPALLLLLTYGLLPTYESRRSGDVACITADCRRAHAILSEVGTELLRSCGVALEPVLQALLDDFMALITLEEEEPDNLNRVDLIYVTTDVLRRLSGMVNPAMGLEVAREHEHCNFILPRLWQADGEERTPDGREVIWEFEPLSLTGVFLLKRHEVNEAARTVSTVRLQAEFRSLSSAEMALCIIHRASFLYNYAMGLPQLPGSLTVHYVRTVETPGSAVTDGNASPYSPARMPEAMTLCTLEFIHSGPLSREPLTLSAIKDPCVAARLTRLIDGEDTHRMDLEPEYAISFVTLAAATTPEAILLGIPGEAATLPGEPGAAAGVVRLERFTPEGEETLPGIAGLTHDDNYVMALLTHRGRPRHIVCLDGIARCIPLEELLTLPFVSTVTGADEIF